MPVTKETVEAVKYGHDAEDARPNMAVTLEERIDEMIESKRALAESVLGAGEGWLTELSTSALRELFTLEAGSVVE